MKKRGLIITLIVLVILLSGAIGFQLYLNMNFPKSIFQKSITNFTKMSNDVLTQINYFDYENKIISIDNNISYVPSNEIKEAYGIDSLSLNYNVVLDNQNKKIFNNFKYLEGDKAYLDIDLLYNNQKGYLNLKDIFDKILEAEIDEETKAEIDNFFDNIINNKKSLNDTQRLIELVGDIIYKNINKDDIVEKDFNVDIEGKSFKLDEYCYTLENEKLYNFILNVLTEMEKNEEIVNILKNTYGMEEVNLVSNFKLDDPSTFASSLYFSLYADNTDIVGLSINTKDASEESKITYIAIDDLYMFETISEDPVYVSGSKDTSGNINLTYRYSIEGKPIGTIKISNNNGEYTLIFTDDTSDMDITLKYKYENVSTEEIKINLELGVSIQGVSFGIIKYNQNSKVVDKIDEFDYSNAVNVSELTEEDTKTIEENLLKQLEGSMIYELYMDYNKRIEDAVNSNIEF